MPSIRQLAAIMFTDIAGYTALMEKNEQKAFELLHKNRSLQQSIITRHKGTWIKEMGDGILSSFPSATHAVACASSIQRACDTIEDLRLHIGIHLGDVVFENGDVFGDGVNVAARLQALAPAGEILVSEAVTINIRNKPGFEVEKFGEVTLKDVSIPVQVYRIISVGGPDFEISMDGITKSIAQKRKRVNERNIILIVIGIVLLLAIGLLVYFKVLHEVPVAVTTHTKSIAVMPFRNESVTKEENQFFCNGMMESVLNNLSQIEALHVIARQSVEQYRGTTLSIPQIGEALGVGFILDGSVQRIGNNVKITASLIDATTNKQVWSNSFPGELDDVFGLQEKIAKQIAGALQVEIGEDVERRIGRVPSQNANALDLFYEAQLEAVRYLFTLPRNDSNYYKIQFLCNMALSLDSNLAEAIVLKAKTYWERKMGNYLKEQPDANELRDSVLSACKRAMALDNNSADALVLLYNYYAFIGKKEQALSQLNKAIAINPNHFEANLYLGNNYWESDNTIDRAFMHLHKALKLDPNSVLTPLVYIPLHLLYLNICDFEKARYYAEKAISQNINTAAKSDGYSMMQALLLRIGTGDDVLKYSNEHIQYDSNALYYAAEAYCYLKNDCAKAVQLYALAWETMPNHPNGHRFAIALWKTGQKDSALKLMQASLEEYKSRDAAGIYSIINYDAAGMYAFLGNKKAAYAILNQPPDNNHIWGWGSPYFIHRDPLFDNIRNEKSFQDIVDKVMKHKETLKERIKKLDKTG